MDRLADLRKQLLTLHRALLSWERTRYERVHGRVSAGSFLDLVVNAPELAWLQPLTALIVGIDELLDANGKSGEEAEALMSTLLGEVQALLVPQEQGNEFHRHYATALQESPDAILHHGAVWRFLGPKSP